MAFTFLYASISAFINPDPWLAYFPEFLRNTFSESFLLSTWGTGELVIGIWLISGYQIFIPSLLSAILMIGIFVFDFESLPITFRNVCILCTSISLAIMTCPPYLLRLFQKKTQNQEEYVEVLDA